VPRLKALGHDVTVFAPASFAGAHLGWENVTVLPGWRDGIGNDIILDHYQRSGAQLLWTLQDAYMLAPEPLSKMNVAHWLPVDCSPVNFRDVASMQATGALPVAMSRWAHDELKREGFSPRYVPHGIDITVFSPPADHKTQRQAIGLSADTFVVGMNAYNKDVIRKGFGEQFSAFAAFHVKHPDSMLLVHSAVADPSAVDLQALARACGIEKAVLFPDQYAYATGLMTPENMAGWYGALDVLTCCSYGEGFGLPVAEAQACGTPVVVTDTSAMSELAGPGWKTSCGCGPDRCLRCDFWVPAHRGWWKRPDAMAVAAAYEEAWQLREDGGMPALRVKSRENALRYDADAILEEHWKPLLKELEDNLPDDPEPRRYENLAC
jgi:glycosyltransferase involved in cell wall biosynthesis